MGQDTSKFVEIEATVRNVECMGMAGMPMNPNIGLQIVADLRGVRPLAIVKETPPPAPKPQNSTLAREMTHGETNWEDIAWRAMMWISGVAKSMGYHWCPDRYLCSAGMFADELVSVHPRSMSEQLKAANAFLQWARDTAPTQKASNAVCGVCGGNGGPQDKDGYYCACRGCGKSKDQPHCPPDSATASVTLDRRVGDPEHSAEDAVRLATLQAVSERDQSLLTAAERLIEHASRQYDVGSHCVAVNIPILTWSDFQYAVKNAK